MATVAVTGTGTGEVIVLGTIGIRIREDGQNTERRLGIAEITLPEHTAGPPQHRHAEHDETFYVLSGTVRFTVATAVHDAPAGTLVVVPPGAPHTFANPTGATTVLLNTFTPARYVDYFRRLRDLAANGEPLTPELMAEVMGQFATEAATGYASPPISKDSA